MSPTDTRLATTNQQSVSPRYIFTCADWVLARAKLTPVGGLPRISYRVLEGRWRDMVFDDGLGYFFSPTWRLQAQACLDASFKQTANGDEAAWREMLRGDKQRLLRIIAIGFAGYCASYAYAQMYPSLPINGCHRYYAKNFGAMRMTEETFWQALDRSILGRPAWLPLLIDILQEELDAVVLPLPSDAEDVKQFRPIYEEAIRFADARKARGFSERKCVLRCDNDIDDLYRLEELAGYSAPLFDAPSQALRRLLPVIARPIAVTGIAPPTSHQASICETEVVASETAPDVAANRDRQTSIVPFDSSPFSDAPFQALQRLPVIAQPIAMTGIAPPTSHQASICETEVVASEMASNVAANRDRQTGSIVPFDSSPLPPPQAPLLGMWVEADLASTRHRRCRNDAIGERAIQGLFRKASLANHPDKVGNASIPLMQEVNDIKGRLLRDWNIEICEPTVDWMCEEEQAQKARFKRCDLVCGRQAMLSTTSQDELAIYRHRFGEVSKQMTDGPPALVENVKTFQAHPICQAPAITRFHWAKQQLLRLMHAHYRLQIEQMPPHMRELLWDVYACWARGLNISEQNREKLAAYNLSDEQLASLINDAVTAVTRELQSLGMDLTKAQLKKLPEKLWKDIRRLRQADNNLDLVALDRAIGWCLCKTLPYRGHGVGSTLFYHIIWRPMWHPKSWIETNIISSWAVKSLQEWRTSPPTGTTQAVPREALFTGRIFPLASARRFLAQLKEYYEDKLSAVAPQRLSKVRKAHRRLTEPYCAIDMSIDDALMMIGSLDEALMIDTLIADAVHDNQANGQASDDGARERSYLAKCVHAQTQRSMQCFAPEWGLEVNDYRLPLQFIVFYDVAELSTLLYVPSLDSHHNEVESTRGYEETKATGGDGDERDSRLSDDYASCELPDTDTPLSKGQMVSCEGQQTILTIEQMSCYECVVARLKARVRAVLSHRKDIDALQSAYQHTRQLKLGEYNANPFEEISLSPQEQGDCIDLAIASFVLDNPDVDVDDLRCFLDQQLRLAQGAYVGSPIPQGPFSLSIMALDNGIGLGRLLEEEVEQRAKHRRVNEELIRRYNTFFLKPVAKRQQRQVNEGGDFSRQLELNHPVFQTPMHLDDSDVARLKVHFQAVSEAMDAQTKEFVNHALYSLMTEKTSNPLPDDIRTTYYDFLSQYDIAPPPLNDPPRQGQTFSTQVAAVQRAAGTVATGVHLAHHPHIFLFFKLCELHRLFMPQPSERCNRLSEDDLKGLFFLDQTAQSHLPDQPSPNIQGRQANAVGRFSDISLWECHGYITQSMRALLAVGIVLAVSGCCFMVVGCWPLGGALLGLGVLMLVGVMLDCLGYVPAMMASCHWDGDDDGNEDDIDDPLNAGGGFTEFTCCPPC